MALFTVYLMATHTKDRKERKMSQRNKNTAFELETFTIRCERFLHSKCIHCGRFSGHIKLCTGCYGIPRDGSQTRQSCQVSYAVRKAQESDKAI